MIRRSAALVLIAGLLASAAVAAPVASAGKPGPSSGCSSPTLSGPTSAVVGDTYTVTGCGFPANAAVNIERTEAGGCCLVTLVGTDASGRFFFSGRVWAAGGYRVRASIEKRRGWTTVASWSFQAT